MPPPDSTPVVRLARDRPRPSGARIVVAVLASATVVLAAPFVGQLRNAIASNFPDQFVAIMAATVGVSIASALLVAIARIRERRALRYGSLLAAVAIGVAYSLVSATGRPEVDAVERFHFVEYGLVTWLFYRAFRYADDASLLVLPVLAGLLVGTLEEWLQWFIPARVGEIRDVLLNVWAIVCGLLFSIGLDPPDRFTPRLRRASWWRVRRLAAVVLVALAAFFHSVHLGHRIDDPEIGSFKSRYSSAVLRQTTLDRERRWRDNPPLTWSRLSREDQYLSEGIAHVQRRNQRWEQGDIRAAWYENLILEKYYAPVLDTDTYVAARHRWSAGHRAEAAARMTLQPAGPYESDAEPAPIHTWPKPLFWTLVVIAAGALLAPVPRAG